MSTTTTTTTTTTIPDRDENESEYKFRRGKTTPAVEADHASNEENDIDPDDRNSMLCSVCILPIFSTPFVKYYDDDGKGGRNVNLVHDQCAILPEKLKDSVLHPGQPLILQKNNPHPPDDVHKCYNCSREICGNKYYACDTADAKDKCSRKYDVLCAAFSPIRILHKSHEHRLMAIPQGTRLSDIICGACGTRHDEAGRLSSSDVSYLCNVCSFWIHPDCALLPNAIKLDQHPHPLALNYRLSSQVHDQNPSCAICGRIIKSVGDYYCTGSHDYRVHIMCAVSDPQSFKQLLIREARLPDLLHLRVPDEHTSVIRYIKDNTIITADFTSSGSTDHHGDDELHEHQLILDDGKDDDNINWQRLCSACVQLIVSSPFYRCSQCSDFFLHEWCFNLPRKLTQHPAHEHPLFLVPKPAGTKKFLSIMYYFDMGCCEYPTNGFTYSCKACYFNMDVLCALMPASITHDAHSKTHILSSSFTAFAMRSKICDCCGERQLGLSYKCGTCNFRLHSRCALLPKTVAHKFDEHPLKLITKTTSTSKRSSGSSSTSTDHDTQVYSSSQRQEVVLLCEICEKYIDNRWWYYSCDECDRSFHIDCIPCLDQLSKIKLGGKIRVKCHDCPLTLIRGFTLVRSHCGYCGKTFNYYNSDLAFECSKCDFRIHFECGQRTNPTFS